MKNYNLMPLIKQTLQTFDKRVNYLRNLKLAIEEGNNENIIKFASLVTGLIEEDFD